MERRDFFVSYNKDNREWAEWIVRVLKKNGYSTYSQFDIKPGEIFLEKMEKFVENSANFMAVWSESYSKSKYCMDELRAAYHQRHYGQMNCLLPVKVDNYPVQAFYAALVHVELSDMGAASEVKLINEVRRAVPRSAPEPKPPTKKPPTPKSTRTDVWKGVVGLLLVIAFLLGAWNITGRVHAAALYALGNVQYNQENYSKAREYYEQAATKGNASALKQLGLLYHDGLGVDVDYAKAREYYEQAAAKGHGMALNNLGYLYHQGLGVDADYAKARDYYEQAAAKGIKEAMYNLGVLYEHGEGVDIDYEKALDYYQKAADAGDDEAPAKVLIMRTLLNVQSG